MPGLATASSPIISLIVKTVVLVGCTRQAALERQDLSRMYLGHRELESVYLLLVIIIIISKPLTIHM